MSDLETKEGKGQEKSDKQNICFKDKTQNVAINNSQCKGRKELENKNSIESQVQQ